MSPDLPVALNSRISFFEIQTFQDAIFAEALLQCDSRFTVNVLSMLLSNSLIAVSAISFVDDVYLPIFSLPCACFGTFLP